jgi:hypothetical protein
MLGDIVPLANNLWLVVGDLPADIPNALVYRAGDRLYLMDSGAGSTMRASILQVLHEVGPVQSFTLLNSHAHADHVGNNDLIHLVEARQTHHYLSEAGLALLDARSYFADQFARLSASYDPATGFQAHRLLWRFAGVVRDLLAAFVGERWALEVIFSLYLVIAFLEILITEHEHFQAVLREILEEHEGLTVGQVYAHVRQRHSDPVVQQYLSLEFPYLPMPLQQIIAVSLLQMGYAAKGPRRKQRFYRQANAA